MIKYVLLLCIIVLFYYTKTEHFDDGMLNIYNEPLEKCGDAIDSGSWDSNGKCSEQGGGVHQICIRNISKNTKGFSKKTGQSDWSDRRGESNHCVCLGAWSLYNVKKKTYNNVLKCGAIPKMSLTRRYVNKFSEGWNKWNGLELDNQVIGGVESLFINCYNPAIKKSEELRKNYCDFAKQNKVLQTKLYNKYC